MFFLPIQFFLPFCSQWKSFLCFLSPSLSSTQHPTPSAPSTISLSISLSRGTALLFVVLGLSLVPPLSGEKREQKSNRVRWQGLTGCIWWDYNACCSSFFFFFLLCFFFYMFPLPAPRPPSLQHLRGNFCLNGPDFYLQKAPGAHCWGIWFSQLAGSI